MHQTHARGVTLIELLVVLVIAVLLVSGVALGSGAVAHARLSNAATRVAAMMKTAVQRSVSTGMQLRLVFDLEAQTFWLEETDRGMVIARNDPVGAGGANPATAAEKAAQEQAKEFNGMLVVPKPAFTPVKGKAGKKDVLGGGIVFTSVDAMHDDKPKSAGRAYMYFIAGESERASVTLKIAGGTSDRDAISVLLSPLTGKITMGDGTVLIARPKTDEEASDAKDNGW
jgi:prepilin-type N-terminal cleavage/methylation domain-containing protein